MTQADASRTAERVPRRSRADVVATALRLLDGGGLAGLSMRGIAQALDLQASALYWHFPNKQSILAAVADEILAPAVGVTGPARPAAPALAPSDAAPEWRAEALETALRLRDALLAVTDGAEVVASTLALGLGERDPEAVMASALAGIDGDAARAATAARTITHYLLGHTQHWQQRRFAERLELAEVSPVDERAEFLDGLELLLDGVARG